MNLIDFLKKYSKINNDFIDDFFGLYDINNKFEFIINLDIVCKWLEIRKDNIKKTLLYSYQENVDYKVTKKKDKKVGAPNEIILLTPKCFKILSMSSKSKKAVLVREYYYELEQLLDRYKDYIINGLKDKIEKLENNQKPKINPKRGVIYVLQTSDDITAYKLGKTTNLKSRLQSYNQDKKDDINVLYIYETEHIDAVEKCVKYKAK
jgi:hypothetical protein